MFRIVTFFSVAGRPTAPFPLQHFDCSILLLSHRFDPSPRIRRCLVLGPCMEVAWWKLRDESVQDEHGKLAPTVVSHRELGVLDCKENPVAPSATPSTQRGIQNAWLGAALEELAQMCGAFLGATARPRGSSVDMPPRLRIIVHAGQLLATTANHGKRVQLRDNAYLSAKPN